MSIEAAAVQQIRETGSVSFHSGRMDGIMRYNGKQVTVSVVKALAEEAGLTVYERHEMANDFEVGDSFDVGTIILTTTKFKSALDYLREQDAAASAKRREEERSI